MTWPTWSTSRRVPWKALFAVTAASTSQIGCRPRSRTASADSTTNAAAPIPTTMPWRRRSNGVATSATTSSVAAAPEARKPEPTQGSRTSLLTSSADTTTTRRQRPARIQSSASETAWVVLAQAALIWVFGPRAPIISANCEWPMARQRKMNRRSYSKRSTSSRWRSSAMRRSTSAAAGSAPVIRARTASRASTCSRLPRSVMYFSMSDANSPYPGKAEAKMTPVSSRMDAGRPHFSGSIVPRVVDR